MSDKCQSCNGAGGTQTSGPCPECYGQGSYSGAVAVVEMAMKPPGASPAWLPYKVVNASLKWLDSVPVGTRLYPLPGASQDPTAGEAGE